jgi:hypothetical protein
METEQHIADDQWVIEEIREEIKKFLELKMKIQPTKICVI